MFNWMLRDCIVSFANCCKNNVIYFLDKEEEVLAHDNAKPHCKSKHLIVSAMGGVNDTGVNIYFRVEYFDLSSCFILYPSKEDVYRLQSLSSFVHTPYFSAFSGEPFFHVAGPLPNNQRTQYVELFTKLYTAKCKKLCWLAFKEIAVNGLINTKHERIKLLVPVPLRFIILELAGFKIKKNHKWLIRNILSMKQKMF